MIQTLRLRPAYSQIMIRDPSAKVDVPRWKKGVSLVASDTCILCGCYPDTDGETQIVIGKNGQVRIGALLVFEGVLKTPSNRIALQTVEGNRVLEIATAGDMTPVRIWVNKSWAPDEVTIGIE